MNTARPITYNGIVYPSVSAAAKHLNTSRGRIRQAAIAGVYRGKPIGYSDGNAT